MTKIHTKLARLWLRQGGVIAYPTEAVWGMGCDPWNDSAVLRLLALKQRPMEKGLILVAASPQQLGPLFTSLTRQQQAVLQETWPGPSTWLIPDPDNLLPVWIKGTHKAVAIRVSNHPVVRELCQAFGGMIVSTSANTSGEPEIRSRLKLQSKLADKLDYLVPGALGDEKMPSTIRDLVSGQVIR